MSLSKAGYNSRLAEINGILIRTDWTAFTLFASGDVVDVVGVLYECIATHTSSATFAADVSTKWILHKIRSITNLNNGQLGGLRNRIINGNFAINQRAYVSGASVGVGLYGHDRWKMAASGDTYTFSTVSNLTTVIIPAGKILRQVIEGVNLETGTYCLSWQGTAQGKIGAGSLSASGITGVIIGGTNTAIEFGPGTVSNIQLEFGAVATVFEQRPYGLELMLCQRYMRPLPAYGCTGSIYSTTTGLIFSTGVPMRATPTLSGTTGIFVTNSSGTGTAITSLIPGVAQADGTVYLTASVASGLVAGGCIALNGNANSQYLSAEL